MNVAHVDVLQQVRTDLPPMTGRDFEFRWFLRVVETGVEARTIERVMKSHVAL